MSSRLSSEKKTEEVCVHAENERAAAEEHVLITDLSNSRSEHELKYLQGSVLHQRLAADRSWLTAGSQSISAGGDVPWSASAERRLPASFRGPRSAASAELPGTGLQRRQVPTQTSAPPRLPRPRSPGPVPPLPTAQEVPFPRVRKSPRRRVLGRRSAERGQSAGFKIRFHLCEHVYFFTNKPWWVNVAVSSRCILGKVSCPINPDTLFISICAPDSIQKPVNLAPC